MQELRLVRALSVLAFAAGCAGAPFGSESYQSDAAGPDAGSDAGSGKVRGAPFGFASGSAKTVPRPGGPTAIAVRAPSTLIGFDVSNGVERWQHELAGVVVDLDWDREQRRLLVVEQSPLGDGSRVHAFAIDGAALTRLASSVAFAPDTRVHGFGPDALALSEEIGTSWTLLGPTLASESPSKLIAKPAGFYSVHAGVWRAIALNPHLLTDGGDADELVQVSHNGVWVVEKKSFAATGRPASRLARHPNQDEAWVVRKHEEFFTFELGEILAFDPAPPKGFVKRVVAGASGTLEAVVHVPPSELLVALLSRSSAAGRLVLLPLVEGQTGVLVELSVSLDHTEWTSRALAATDGGIVWVATRSGCRGYRLATGSAPAASFLAEAPGLVAPLVIAE